MPVSIGLGDPDAWEKTRAGGIKIVHLMKAAILVGDATDSVNTHP